MNKKKGFTLIELMVVISIIGLLSSVLTTSVSASKVKARESKRIQEVRQVELALQLYADDNGGYPVDTDSADCVNTSLEALVPKYISRIPADPINNNNLCYRYTSTPGTGPNNLATAATITFVSEIKKVTNSTQAAFIGIAVGQPNYENPAYTGSGGYPGTINSIINTGFNNTY